MGHRFCVIACQSERRGWNVSTAYVSEGDDFDALDEEFEQLPEKATSPFCTEWIVPLILPVIIDTPAISNKNLKQFLSVYGLDYALTDSILQEARTETK